MSVRNLKIILIINFMLVYECCFAQTWDIEGHAIHIYASHLDFTIFQLEAATKLATYVFNRLKARISELEVRSNLRNMQNNELWLTLICIAQVS